MYCRLFAIIALTSSLSSHAQSANRDPCHSESLLSFYQVVQSYSQSDDANSRSFSNCSFAVKSQIIYWINYAKHVNFLKNSTKGQWIPEKPFSSSSISSSAKMRILQASLDGKPEELKQKIDEGDPDYINDQNALLNLARGLAISSRLKESGLYFETYLKINPTDELADAEYLYSLIWSGDYISARGRLARMRTYDLSPYLKGVMTRAEESLSQLESLDEDPKRHQINLPGTFKGTWEQLKLSDESRRDSYLITYQNYGRGRFGIHDIESALDQKKDRSIDFQIGGDFSLSSFLHFTTEVGYYSIGDDNFFGKFSSRINFFDLSIEAGAERDPLSLIYVVPKIAHHLMRNRAYVLVELSDYFDFEGSLAKDGHYSPYESYEANFKLPAFTRNYGKESLTIKVPIFYEAYPKPSFLYPTVPVRFSSGLGLDYNRMITDSYEFRGKIVYLLENLNSHSNRDSYQRLGTYRIEADFVYFFDSRLSFNFGAKFYESEKELYEVVHDRSLLLQAGLGYRPTAR